MVINKSGFKFHDCILMISPTGQVASNLKEFQNILGEAEDAVIYYHLYQSTIKNQLRYPEYPNDFANWTADALGDFSLAEKLANIDPYDFNIISDVKNSIIEIIEEHIWDLSTIPWARPGFEFNFCCSTIVIYPIGIEASNIAEFKESLSKIPRNSLYYHFFEARMRNGNKIKDDFSIWIEENFYNDEIIKSIRNIDFYFYSLSEIRKKLIDILNNYLSNEKI